MCGSSVAFYCSLGNWLKVAEVEYFHRAATSLLATVGWDVQAGQEYTWGVVLWSLAGLELDCRPYRPYSPVMFAVGEDPARTDDETDKLWGQCRPESAREQWVNCKRVQGLGSVSLFYPHCWGLSGRLVHRTKEALCPRRGQSCH